MCASVVYFFNRLGCIHKRNQPEINKKQVTSIFFKLNLSSLLSFESSLQFVTTASHSTLAVESEYMNTTKQRRFSTGEPLLSEQINFGQTN